MGRIIDRAQDGALRYPAEGWIALFLSLALTEFICRRRWVEEVNNPGEKRNNVATKLPVELETLVTITR